jgi:hypothetical protein
MRSHALTDLNVETSRTWKEIAKSKFEAPILRFTDTCSWYTLEQDDDYRLCGASSHEPPFPVPPLV